MHELKSPMLNAHEVRYLVFSLKRPVMLSEPSPVASSRRVTGQTLCNHAADSSGLMPGIRKYLPFALFYSNEQFLQA
jgi:hypothetical protein